MARRRQQHALAAACFFRRTAFTEQGDDGQRRHGQKGDEFARHLQRIDRRRRMERANASRRPRHGDDRGERHQGISRAQRRPERDPGEGHHQQEGQGGEEGDRHRRQSEQRHDDDSDDHPDCGVTAREATNGRLRDLVATQPEQQTGRKAQCPAAVAQPPADPGPGHGGQIAGRTHIQRQRTTGRRDGRVKHDGKGDEGNDARELAEEARIGFKTADAFGGDNRPQCVGERNQDRNGKAGVKKAEIDQE